MSRRHAASTSGPAKPRILILVENLPVPFDRRVWQEATTLAAAGYEVTVICPKGRGHVSDEEELDGVRILRHPLREAKGGAFGYVAEYAAALYHQARLTFRVWRRDGFDVVQACNPPDLLFLVALPYRLFRGVPFIFDHHDLSPELFEVKFGGRGPLHWLLRQCERATFALADVSIATNETFRDIAIERGGMERHRVRIVRSYPNLKRFRRSAPALHLKRPGELLVGYLGVIGGQDGVDTLVRAAAAVLHGPNPRPMRFLIVGDGPALAHCKALAETLGVADHMTFTGYLSGETLLAHLSAIDVGVIPDPCNIFNDKLSMNKVFEYMALGVPFVQFNLVQAASEAGSAALVVQDAGPEALAAGLVELCDDPERRRRMSEEGRARALREFDWSTQAPALLEAYDLALERRRRIPDAARELT